MKRVFGIAEAIFDILYITAASAIGIFLLFSASENNVRLLAGLMALILAGGDAFHLVPRIIVIVTGRDEQLRKLLGRGKQAASVTMTLFYVLLWHIGVLAFTPKEMIGWSIAVYFIAAARIVLCLMPQNHWEDRYPPVTWEIWRNIPFFILGITAAGLYYFDADHQTGIALMWLAILLSFAFYLPVVLFANKNPKTGMLMFPKTCMYLWMLVMCLSL